MRGSLSSYLFLVIFWEMGDIGPVAQLVRAHA